MGFNSGFKGLIADELLVLHLMHEQILETINDRISQCDEHRIYFVLDISRVRVSAPRPVEIFTVFFISSNILLSQTMLALVYILIFMKLKITILFVLQV